MKSCELLRTSLALVTVWRQTTKGPPPATGRQAVPAFTKAARVLRGITRASRQAVNLT